SLLVGWTTDAQSRELEQTMDQLQSKPYAIPNQNTQNNNSIFKKYCVGSADSLKTPAPNYDNEHVKSAALILQKTKDGADLKLEEMFKQNWALNIETIKSYLEALKGSPNTLVAKLAAQFESSLDVEKTGFSEQQKKWYETMVD